MQNQQQKRQKKSSEGRLQRLITRASPAIDSGEKLPAVVLFKERNTILGKRVKGKLHVTIPDIVQSELQQMDG